LDLYRAFGDNFRLQKHTNYNLPKNHTIEKISDADFSEKYKNSVPNENVQITFNITP